MLLVFGVLRAALAAPPGWTVVGVTDGVEVAQQSSKGSDLLSFRGETTTSVPIAKLAGLLQDDPKATEWVNLMSVSDSLDRIDEQSRYLYQVIDLPWPVQDRDYLLKRTVNIDVPNKVFTVSIVSTVNSQQKPEQECCIRADITKTLWHLQRLDNGKTKVVVEVTTDPKGSLPAWLVNMLQQDWPHKTVNGLLKRAQKADIAPDPSLVSW